VLFFDVTRPLSGETVVYTGDVVPQLRQEDRGPYLITELHLSSHSGTHIDAPVHYLKEGMTVDKIPLPTLIGKCRVIDLGNVAGEIGPEHLEPHLDGVSRMLLKTRYSAVDRFDPDYPYLGVSAARFLTERGMRCVGIDSPSIEAFHCDGSVHRELLCRGCIIIELLDLSGVAPGDYTMIALPLRLYGIDGSPARVVLCRDGD
jgi:arylformamidase